jgi:hypothetical protein
VADVTRKPRPDKYKRIEMKIHSFHFRRRSEKKVTSKLDRIVDTTLLDAAVKNPDVLAQVINKYGEIRLRHTDMEPIEAKDIEDKVFRESVQIMLSSRRQELVSRLNGIIDRVMGLNNRINRQQNTKHGSDPVVPIRGLMMLNALNDIANRQRGKQLKGGFDKRA